MTEDVQKPEPITCSGGITIPLPFALVPDPEDKESLND